MDKITITFAELAESEKFNEFHKILWDFTHVPMNLVGPDNKSIKYFCPPSNFCPICKLIRSTKAGEAKCLTTDNANCSFAIEHKKGLRYFCHAGLIDYAVPIYIEGKHIATISCGQLLPTPPSQKGCEKLYEKIKDLNLDKNKFKKAYFQSIYMPPEKLESLYRLLAFFAEYFCDIGLSLKKTIEDHRYLEIERAKEFIKNNYREPITLEIVANHIAFSESYFSRIFHRIERKTFTQYMQNLRLTEAKKLLRNTDWTICRIAFNVGFSNLSYFNEFFRKSEHCTPSQYRKQIGLVTPNEIEKNHESS
ncbi:MAG: hypothetical protein A2Y12_19765 [Planctomycetes bacterium GWF2_42_9]|nr:MAG: hypothetical protein A2Y12_19765 [Planctomycetes bacterium GWF2_42_9]